jgi:hypothetical protein
MVAPVGGFLAGTMGLVIGLALAVVTRKPPHSTISPVLVVCAARGRLTA